MNKKSFSFAFFLLCIFCVPAPGADTVNPFDFAASGDRLYKAQAQDLIRVSASSDMGRTFPVTRTVASLESSCDFIKLIAGENKVRVFWLEKNSLYTSSSNDVLMTWTPPVKIYTFSNPPGRSFSLDSSGNYICLAFFDQQSKTLAARESFDGGASWKGALTVYLSPTGPSSIKVCVNSGISSIGFLFKDKGRNTVYISSKGSNEAAWTAQRPALTETRDLDSFDLSASDRGTLFLSARIGSELSVKRAYRGGAAWKSPKNYLLPYSDKSPEYLRLIPGKDRLTAALDKDTLFTSDEKLWDAPRFGASEDIYSATGEVSVELLPYKGIESLFYGLELGEDRDFGQGSFRTIEPSGLIFKAPADLSDGTYFLRARIENGTSASYSTVRTLTLDREKPFLNVVSPLSGATVEAAEVKASGSAETGASLFVNGKSIFLDGAGYFDTKIELKPGFNMVIFEASDRAGNKTLMTRMVFFDASAVPMILVKPKETDWIKPGSAVALEISVPSGVFTKDGQEAAITFNNSTLESSLVYDGPSNSIGGFIKLPDYLLDGRTAFLISVKDDGGRVVKGNIALNIDSKAPAAAFASGTGRVYSNRTDLVVIPLADDGSGADLINSKVKLSASGVTVEARSSMNKDASSIIMTPLAPLSDGLYDLEIVPRDLAGNTGPAKKYLYVVDTEVPYLNLSGDAPAKTSYKSISVSGNINKAALSGVSVTDNGKTVRAASIKGGSFSAIVDLNPGENIIVITAADLAGNKVSLSRTVFFAAPPETVYFNFDGVNIGSGDYVQQAPAIKITDASGSGIAAATVKIDGAAAAYDPVTGTVAAPALSFGLHTIVAEAPGKTYETSFRTDGNVALNGVIPCPNPFDPGRESVAITFNCSKSSTVTLLVFDAKGSLVFRSQYSGSIGFNSGLTWNGKDSAGEAMADGTYLVNLIARDASGGSSRSKSKVVILR